ncbi:sugar ABC transporter substrate-binding protein [Bifidobacterium tsurumiense]|uniref:ABC-type sugar transport system, periplasmic component n=1 Tax=Bifidobacterium tsurumiense TaxID=356829 RepID=A0A087ECL4_9BIFI|nr:sugar ABC transporter substrate-binding protein [Bifidobacterium tsurumiense]KFJ05515.1 ABC-type sugar transport system, periplasmic component [Bifidobacterium tsurumiense]MDY4677784.1 sugar ABC transporter substrate-binding protein [Bifidobacterium tsurumiense]
MKFTRILAATAAAAVLLVGGLSGCGSSGSSQSNSGSSSSSIKLGYVPSTMNNPFWQAILDGVNEQIDGKDVSVQSVDPQADQSKMNDMVGDLIASGVNAIILGPYDTTGVQPALQAAADANIPVINIDTPVDAQDLVKTVVASDNEKAGALVAADMKKKLDKGSQVAVVNCPAGQACIDRLNGFKAEAGDYFDIVQELDGKGELSVSLTLTEDILQSNPDVKAIFGVNDPMALGAVQALAAHPEMSGVLVYGVDGSPDGKKAIKDGTMTGTGAQSPNQIGKKAAQAALDVLDGKTVEKNIVVDTFLITKDNVDEYGTDGWQ